MLGQILTWMGEIHLTATFLGEQSDGGKIEGEGVVNQGYCVTDQASGGSVWGIFRGLEVF